MRRARARLARALPFSARRRSDYPPVVYHVEDEGPESGPVPSEDRLTNMRVSRRLAIIPLVLAFAVLPGTAESWHGTGDQTNDHHYPKQWGLRKLGVPAAWHTARGSGVSVAVVDTGVNASHIDLAANMHPKGWDFLDHNNHPHDLQGHGTHVAGIVAAVTNNKEGIAGTAPRARIMAVRVGGRNAGDRTVDGQAVFNGIIWAVDQGAQVINLSLGAGIPAGGAMDVAVAYAFARGATVVAAAGNESNPWCSSPAFSPLALCVGAVNRFNHLEFSNFGAGIDVVAPGVDIISTEHWGGYGSKSGTSMAAPYVAGVAALLMGMGATNLQAMNIIKMTAEDLGLPGYDHTYGWGRVDAKAAVDLCAQICVKV